MYLLGNIQNIYRNVTTQLLKTTQKLSRGLKDIFSHIWYWLISTCKAFQHHLSLGKCKSKPQWGTLLVVQWLRIHLLGQGTRVPALVREDPTCCGATKPMCPSYWACALEPTSHNYWACMPQLLKPAHLEPVLHNREGTAMRSPRTAMKSSPRSPQLEKARAQQRGPNTAKDK